MYIILHGIYNFFYSLPSFQQLNIIFVNVLSNDLILFTNEYSNGGTTPHKGNNITIIINYDWY